MNIKYSHAKHEIENAVKISKSIASVLGLLGMRKAGGNYRNIQLRILKLGIDTSHFTGKAHNTGKRSNRRLSAHDILIDRTRTGERHQEASILRRSLLEIGIQHKCTNCENTGMWQGKRLTLQIDHIDGNWLDDRKENLRFLCPNCHSQTSTFCVGNRKIVSSGTPAMA